MNSPINARTTATSLMAIEKAQFCRMILRACLQSSSVAGSRSKLSDIITMSAAVASERGIEKDRVKEKARQREGESN